MGVLELEIAAVTGHRMPDARTTKRYLQVAPDYLANARRVLDDLANDNAEAATQAMLPGNMSAGASAVGRCPDC